MLAEAGHDEERVVDSYTKADHQRQLRAEVGHVDDVTDESRHPETRGQPYHGGHDREPHRRERPEADQQDQDRRSKADDRREPERSLLGLLDRLAAELDLERG